MSPFPIRTQEWGLGSGCPQGSKGAAESHLPSIAAATRAESRGSNSSCGGVSMVWADASSSPLPSGPATSRRRTPPNWGVPLFSSFTLLLYSYPSTTRTRDVGEVVEFGAWGGSADRGVLPYPQIQTLHPQLFFSLLFPPPWAKLTAPSPSRLRLQKRTIGRRRGGGWGAWTGLGSPWKGPDGALGAPLVSASVHRPGARTTVPRTEVPWGGLGGEREGTGRGGRERRGGERKRGGEKELRGSPVSAHAPIWRAALGRGSLSSYDIWSFGQRFWTGGAQGVASRFGDGSALSPDWALLLHAADCRRDEGGSGSEKTRAASLRNSVSCPRISGRVWKSKTPRVWTEVLFHSRIWTAPCLPGLGVGATTLQGRCEERLSFDSETSKDGLELGPAAEGAVWGRGHEGPPHLAPGLEVNRDTRGDTPELVLPPRAWGWSPP